MKKTATNKWLHPFLLIPLLCSCSFFQDASKSMKHIESISEKVDKDLGKMEKEQQKQEEKAASQEKHETALLDHKVIAMRVQAALKKEGTEFGEVTVEGTREDVVLTGTVKSEKAKARAAEIARGVDAKVKLKNELRVAK